jgi:hypothetical protein
MGFLAFLGAILGAILLNVVASDLYDWSGRLASWLITRSVQRLPPELRDRYREEWLAHAEEIPGKITKLVHALGVYTRASARIRDQQEQPRPALRLRVDHAAFGVGGIIGVTGASLVVDALNRSTYMALFDLWQLLLACAAFYSCIRMLLQGQRYIEV